MIKVLSIFVVLRYLELSATWMVTSFLDFTVEYYHMLVAQVQLQWATMPQISVLGTIPLFTLSHMVPPPPSVLSLAKEVFSTLEEVLHLILALV